MARQWEALPADAHYRTLTTGSALSSLVIGAHEVRQQVSSTSQSQASHRRARTLADAIALAEPRTRAHAMALVRGAALALDAFHAHGRVHGEIGPTSFLLVDDERLALRPPRANVGPRDDRSHDAAIYLSPQRRAGEQARQSDDLYALGQIAYQLLAASLMPDGALSAGGHTLPPPVEAVLQAQMAWSPAERLSSGAELVRELDRAFTNPVVGLVGAESVATAGGTRSQPEPAWAAASRVAQARRAHRLAQNAPSRPARPQRTGVVRAPLGKGHYPDMPLPLGWVAAIVIVLCSVYLLPLYFMLFPAG